MLATPSYTGHCGTGSMVSGGTTVRRSGVQRVFRKVPKLVCWSSSSLPDCSIFQQGLPTRLTQPNAFKQILEASIIPNRIKKGMHFQILH